MNESEDEKENRCKKRLERKQNVPILEMKKEKRRKQDAIRRSTMTDEQRSAFNEKRRALHLKRKKKPITEDPPIQDRGERPIPQTPEHIQQAHSAVVVVDLPQALNMMHYV